MKWNEIRSVLAAQILRHLPEVPVEAGATDGTEDEKPGAIRPPHDVLDEL